MSSRDAQWVFYYDGECGFCRTIVRSLARLDWFRAIEWVPFQMLDTPPPGLSWSDLGNAAYLRNGGGRLWRGFYALRMLCLRIPLLLPLIPLAWFPGAHFLATPTYRWVAKNRYWASRCHW